MSGKMVSGLIAAFIVLMFVAIILGGMKVSKENNAIRGNCELTDLYVIGNKGVAEQVYDCSGVNIDDRR